MNEASEELSPGSTVAQLAAARSRTDQGVAVVAVNDQVVTKTSWADMALAEGDQVDILTAVQGGVAVLNDDTMVMGTGGAPSLDVLEEAWLPPAPN